MEITDEVNNIEVSYDEDDNRKVRCFCDEVCNKSLLPHLRKVHPEIWDKWCLDFVRLRNKGWSLNRIMWKYRAIFTWTVIEQEIRRIVEEGKAELKIRKKDKIGAWAPPNPELETTTIWNFPERGKWATHQSDYRGNWPPQLPRNLIMKYTTDKKSVVFDPFVGGGTTLIEAYLLGRRSIGIDVNPVAIKMSKKRIREMEVKGKKTDLHLIREYRPIVKLGDARKSFKILSKLGFGENSLDLVCTHPPYLNAIKYTETIEADLSHIRDAELFCNEIQKVAQEIYVLLRDGGICAVLVGDTRKGKKLIPLGFEVMKQFLEEKFRLEEIIIKLQHQDKSTQFYFNKNLENYLLAHEYIFVFKK